MKDIVFICGVRDFHAMDKYWITAKAVYPRKVLLLTDLIESENQPKLISTDTPVYHLFNIDKLLFKKQSSFGNIWRNLIKVLFVPVQIYYLKKFYKNHPDCIYHAIPMYYMMLCYLAKIPFVATPQGSEILVRPLRSKIYRRFAVKSLQAAHSVIVDSVNMQNKVFQLSGVMPIIMKNGFNTSEILGKSLRSGRQTILSIRGFNPGYRIEKILEGRLQSAEKLPLSFVYPACEEDYKKRIKAEFFPEDRDLGRLDKCLLYEEMVNTLLAVSIPQSDSSPRSVYECIFAGACVAVTESPYIHELPKCMKERIYLVNIDDKYWFDKALIFAKKTTLTPFVPSDEALEMCDQEKTIRKIVDKIYS